MLGRNVISLLALPAASTFTLPDGATSADVGELRVAWSSPDGCPTAQDAVERVRGLLGQDIASVLHHTLEARALVTRLDSGKFKLELETRQGSEGGVRNVEADTCQELTEVGSLVIALTIDPELLERNATTAAPAASAAPSVAPPPAPVEKVKSPPPPPTAAKARARPADERAPGAPRARGRGDELGVGLGLAAVADAGSLPGTGLGMELGIHSQWSGWRLEFAGIFLPQRSELAAGSSVVGGRIDLLALSVKGCVFRQPGAFGGGACGVFEFGRRSAEGFGAAINGSASATWVAPGLGVYGGYEFSRGFSFRGRVEALAPLERSEFIVENVGSVDSPSAIVLRLGLGLDADF
jgi:hypothetical protein